MTRKPFSQQQHNLSQFSTTTQALSAVELKPPSTQQHQLDSNDDDDNNNVPTPQTAANENRIRKNGRHEKVTVRRIENSQSDDGGSKSTRKRNDDYCDVLPSDNDVNSRRPPARRGAQNAQKRCDTNEKSHVDVKKVQPSEGGSATAACSIWNTDKSTTRTSTNSSRAADIALGRTRDCLTKISEYLDYVHEICEFPPEMEDINDLRRRQKRSTEFSSRFARNHLYQIGRIVSLP